MRVKQFLRRLGLGPGAGDPAEAREIDPETGLPVPRSVTPFVPRGRVAPVFFLHIPKSSGSSVNTFLRTLYGPKNFIDHIEYRLPDLLNGKGAPCRMDGISGHVPLCRWSLYPGAGAYAWATVLRDPWARLVSHINWVHRFNIDQALPPPNSARARANHAVAAILRSARFDTAEEVAQFHRAVSAVPDFVGFDNLQVRLLLTASTRDEIRRLVPEDARRAVANLSRFRIVGFCEDQAAFQRAVLDHMGRQDPPQVIRENTGIAPLLQADNAVAREVLRPWYALDAQLVEAARG